jgi:hypothetical protein
MKIRCVSTVDVRDEQGTQLTVEGSSYAVVLKDLMDPCGYTLFSDQGGVIYVGSPLQ